MCLLSYTEINVISVQCVLPTGNTGTDKKDINVYLVYLFLGDL